MHTPDPAPKPGHDAPAVTEPDEGTIEAEEDEAEHETAQAGIGSKNISRDGL